MPILTCRRLDRGLAIVLLASTVTAHAAPCQFVELRVADGLGANTERRANGLSWSVRIDSNAETVGVSDASGDSRCRIDLEDVRQAFGKGDTLVLRVMDIASDELYFFDARSCASRRLAVDLGVSRSLKAERRALARAGICAGTSAASPPPRP